MRPVFLCALLVASAACAEAASPAAEPAVTVVLDFQSSPPTRSVDSMKREVEGIMKGSGLAFNWRSREEATQASYENLVVIRFKGKCLLEPAPYLYDERGPFAFTYSSGSDVLPYSEVACDKIAASMRSAMSGDDFNRADALLGRALGRVVAHELVHILTRSGEHSREGVTKEAFSASQLLSGRLTLSQEDVARIQHPRPETRIDPDN